MIVNIIETMGGGCIKSNTQGTVIIGGDTCIVITFDAKLYTSITIKLNND